MSKFRVVRSDENRSWPSGLGGAWVAYLSVTDADLESGLGTTLETFWAEGLGPARGIGLELASGRAVELIRYDNHLPNVYHLMGDAADDLSATLDETLAALELSAEVVIDRFDHYPEE